MNGVQNRGGGDQEQVVEVGSNQRKGSSMVMEVLLRAAALGLTVAAAVVMGTDKQTTTAPVQVSPSLPPIIVPVTAKWHYLSAFLFFVVANAIACGYAAVSLLLTFLNKGKGKGGRSLIIGVVVIITDILTVALLFSSTGAATAVGILGREGNSHVQWNKVCNIFGAFCDRVMAAIILSLLGSISFLLLAVLAVLGLRHRTRSTN